MKTVGSLAPLGMSVMLALVVLACGGAPSMTGKPDGSSETGRPGDTSAPISALLAPVSAASVAEFDNAMLEYAGSRSGLAAALGPTTWGSMVDLLRSAASDAAGQAGIARLNARLASIDGARPPALTAAGGGGVSLGLAWGMASAMLDSGSRVTSGNVTSTDTREVIENGTRTVGQVTMNLQFSLTGSLIQAAVDMTIQMDRFDAATGASTGSDTLRMGGTIEIDFCPDGGGSVSGSSSLSIDVSGSTGQFHSFAGGQAVGSVGDDAYLRSVDMSASAGDAQTPPNRQMTETAVSFGATFVLGPHGSLDGSTVQNETGAIDRDTANASQETVDGLMKRAGEVAGVALGVVAGRAQEKWRGGACLEIRSTESGRDVSPSELVQFTASLWHRFEGNELNKPIHSTFSGKASLDPVDIDVPAPVLLSFKAGTQDGDTGTVTLKSTSNRGIAELEIPFRVKPPGWKIDASFAGGRLTGEKCGDPTGDWVVDGTYDRSGMRGTQRWTITIDASGSGGTFTYADKAEGRPGGSPVTVFLEGRAAGRATFSLDASGRALMHLTETTHEIRTYTDLGGAGWSSTTVGTYDLTWETGASC